MGTFIAGLLVAGCVVIAIRSMIRDKKNKKASCGGDCGHCGGCH